VLVVVVTVGALTAAGLAWYLARRDDPKSVTLPPPQQQGATAHYLGHQGRVVVTFWRKTATVDPNASRTDCVELARELTAITSPPELEQLASAVPDPALRDAALAQLHAVGGYLASCSRGRDVSAAAAEVHFDGVVLGRLLARVGAR
jgi:hypothetical protein